MGYNVAMSRRVFGPVPSRRLGFSLGVDPIPRKYCNYDCIYCQVGKTADKETERRSFFDPHQIVAEVLKELTGPKQVDVITFSGSGEPTLNRDLGWMIRELKRKVRTPVAVITNGSLLAIEEVKQDLEQADIVLPSLDAVSEALFEQINRPHPSISLASVIKGLRSFCAVYRGRIWLEILFVRGVNDTAEELQRFKAELNSMALEKIQLNTVTRPSHETAAQPLEAAELARIGRVLDPRCEVIRGFDKRSEALGIDDWVAGLMDILERRSLTIDDIVSLTGIGPDDAKERIQLLEEQGRVQAVEQGGRLFYAKKEALQ